MILQERTSKLGELPYYEINGERSRAQELDQGHWVTNRAQTCVVATKYILTSVCIRLELATIVQKSQQSTPEQAKFRDFPTLACFSLRTILGQSLLCQLLVRG